VVRPRPADPDPGRRSACRLAERSTVLAHGPRITAFKAGDVRSFQGPKARRLAVLGIPAGFDLGGSGPGRFHQDTVINRDTEWLFSAGKPVHQLLDPEGRVHVMQAYSHIVDDTLTMDAPPGLGDRLQLPAGRAYRTEIPEHDLVPRTTTGEAHILQDESENTCMLLTH
jgi:hypothetical protein